MCTDIINSAPREITVLMMCELTPHKIYSISTPFMYTLHLDLI